MLNAKKSPNLHQLFGSNTATPRRLLNTLSGELSSILGYGESTVDFEYNNGRKGRAVLLPKVKSQDSFLEQARRLQWIEKMLDHLAGGDMDKEDAAQ